MDFEVAVTERKGAPVGDATVTVMPEVPLIGIGDVLATAGWPTTGRAGSMT